MTTTITGATCSAVCWMAEQEACSCSCGGRNHGCLKAGVDGVQPDRTSRIQGVMYKLVAVGTYREVQEALRAAQQHIKETEEKVVSRYGYARWDYSSNQEGSRFWTRKATDSQINSWPELSAAKAWEGPRYSEWSSKPFYTLWERV